jgi:hypothetical protein
MTVIINKFSVLYSKDVAFSRKSALRSLEKKENKTKYHAKIDIFFNRLRADKIS